MAVLKFETNVPAQIALAYDEGKLVEGRFGDQVMYTLASPAGHTVYFATTVDAKIHELGISRGELFNVCKREVVNGKRRTIQWDVWRPEDGEVAGAGGASPSNDGGDGTGIEDSALMREVRQSIHIAQNGGKGTWPERKAAAAALATAAASPNATQPGGADGRLLAPTRTNNNGHSSTNGPGGNGNNGHRTAALPAPGGQPPLKIPMDEAFVECVRIVQRAMKETGEQWSDAARQDMVSTLLINARQEGWLAVWTRGGAA